MSFAFVGIACKILHTIKTGCLLCAILTAVHTNRTFRNLMESQWDRVSPKILNVEDEPEIAKRLKSQYLTTNRVSGKELDLIHDFSNYTDMLSDGLFNHPLQVSAQLHSQFAPVFLYYNSYTAEYSASTLMEAVKGNFNIVIEIMASFLKHFIHRKVLGTYPRFHGKFNVYRPKRNKYYIHNRSTYVCVYWTARKTTTCFENCSTHSLWWLYHKASITPTRPLGWKWTSGPDYQMSRDLIKSITDFASLE